MTNANRLVLSSAVLLLAAPSASAGELSRYRGFQLHDRLRPVAMAAGLAPEDARAIHQRPALIQELRWRPSPTGGQQERPDPVREIIFTFYNDELSLIAVDYDVRRIEGLTNADLIEAVSATYGPPVLTGQPRTSVAPGADADTVIARWADPESSLVLLRGIYPTSLRLLVTSKRLDGLARTAALEAVREDERDAPQRVLDQERKKIDDRRLLLERARTLNKPAFKP